jgi:selenoprotein W-related protein
LAAELLENFARVIEKLTLIPSSGGRFEVEVNGKLIYSKLATGEFPAPGEIQTLLKTYIQDNA